MKILEEEIQFAGENLIFNNQRVIFWPKQSILILSDLHLGKSAHFRRNGIAIPIMVSKNDLKRLELLIENYKPEQVIITGDLIHAGVNNETILFKALTEKFKDIQFILIRGNHDRVSLNHIHDLGINYVLNELIIDGISFTHELSKSNFANISGHIHPGIRMKSAVKKHITLPCFVIGEHQIIMPAFSLFTGMDTRHILEEARYLIFQDDAIFKL